MRPLHTIEGIITATTGAGRNRDVEHITLANWWREFGDNDALGWGTTFAYFIVAAVCFRSARVARRNEAPPTPATGGPPQLPGEQDRPADWYVIAAGLVLLGLNKQLDLQILARDTGLAVVKAAGFDEGRRWVGRLFVLCLSAAVLWVLARAARRLSRARRGHTLTLVGLTLLACFVIIRSAGYLPILRQFNLRFKDLLHVVLELGGLVIVGVSAWRSASARRPPPQLEHQ
jgi:hypothetical protein